VIAAIPQPQINYNTASVYVPFHGSVAFSGALCRLFAAGLGALVSSDSYKLPEPDKPRELASGFSILVVTRAYNGQLNINHFL
jgi:hypothetical protein